MIKRDTLKLWTQTFAFVLFAMAVATGIRLFLPLAWTIWDSYVLAAGLLFPVTVFLAWLVFGQKENKEQLRVIRIKLSIIVGIFVAYSFAVLDHVFVPGPWTTVYVSIAIALSFQLFALFGLTKAFIKVPK